MCDLRLRVVYHRDRAQSWGLDLRVVVSRRGWRHSHSPCDCRPGGVQLRSRATTARLWARRLGRRHRCCCRATHRWALHHVPVLALGLRGRGRRGTRDSRPHPPDGRHPARGGRQARPGRDRVVSPRTGAHRLWHPPLWHLGIRAGQVRSTRVARPLARRLADPVWGGRASPVRIHGN